MIYLDDIYELIDDVPDELQRRGGLIQDWERQADEYKREADRLAARLEGNPTLTDEEKANLFRQIGEMLDRARDVSEKKYEMAAKTHKLVQMLDARVTEMVYNCKIELEVDAPGTALKIENNFRVERMMKNAAANNLQFQNGLGEFRMPDEKQQSMMRDFSSSMSRESTPYERAAAGGRGSYEKMTTRDSSLSSSRASSLAPSSVYAVPVSMQQLHTELTKEQRKRKKDRQRERQAQQLPPKSAAGAPAPALSNPLSAYMRKKKEREREQRKLREVREASEERRRKASHSPHPSTLSASAAGARLDDVRRTAYVHAIRERNSQQRVIKPEPYDDGYETLQQQAPLQPVATRPRGRPPGTTKAAGSRTNVVNPMLATVTAPPFREERREQQQPERREEVEDTLNGGMSDMEDDDLLKFLNDEMPEGIADHDDLDLGLEDENLFDMASFGADLGKELENIQQQGRPPSPLGQNYYGTLNAPSKSSAAGPSRYSNTNPKPEIKRQQSQQLSQYVSLPFGAGESLHGRQRKLTTRAEIHAIEQGVKVQMRKRKEEEMSNGDYARNRSRDASMAADSIGSDLWDAGLDDTAEDTALYCYCNTASDGTMVGCEGKKCKFGGWFHLACLRMEAPPAVEKWYCHDCRRQR